MKKHLLKIFVTVLSFLIIFFVWKMNKKDKDDYVQGIRPPLPSINIPYEEYAFDADKGILIERQNGTLIRIPKNAFIDSSGQKVTGKVIVKVREFHVADDIFRSGIPMSVDSSRNGFLESAGMIDIRAFSNGSALELAEGSEAEISLAGFKNSKGYRLYHLENDKNWKVTDTFSIVKNDLKLRGLDSLQLVLKQTEKQDIIFDLVTNMDEAPYLKAFEGLKWKISKRDVDDELLEAMRVQWDEVSVKPVFLSTKKFKLIFKKQMAMMGDSTPDLIKTFQINAIPIKNGGEISNSEMKFLYQNYNSVKVLIDAETERLKKQADLLNSFTIQKLGIWNCDKLINMNELVYKEVGFNFKGNIDPKINNISLYVIYLDNNSVIEYRPNQWNKVGFLQNSRMQLKLVIPGGKLVQIDDAKITNALENGDSRIVFEGE